MSRRVIINVTSSARWRRRPVGILRVERELAKQLRRRYGSALLPVVFDELSGTFLQLTPSDLEVVLSDTWVTSENPDAEAELKPPATAQLRPKPGDAFISAGSDWSYSIPATVAKLYGTNKVLMTACYDLIPLLYPEYTPDAGFYRQFHHHYTQIARTGRSVFAISENSKADLLQFWRESGLSEDAPPVNVVPLAALPVPQTPTALPPGDNDLFETIKHDGDYIIYVSTIEPRKNHQLLLDIWRELFATRAAKCPQLILIGMRGWGSSDLIAQLGRMEAFKAGRIKWLEGLSDELLTQLYRDSLFTVFPSFYEGWGLAATEAMAYGKVCLISNNSALAEAAQNLAPSLHPNDFMSWRHEINRLIDDSTYRRRLERDITDKFRPRSWDDFGNQLFEKLESDT